MDWINGLFSTNPAAQTVIVLSMITAAGSRSANFMSAAYRSE